MGWLDGQPTPPLTSEFTTFIDKATPPFLSEFPHFVGLFNELIDWVSAMALAHPEAQLTRLIFQHSERQ
jgi:hypothetical protein